MGGGRGALVRIVSSNADDFATIRGDTTRGHLDSASIQCLEWSFYKRIFGGKGNRLFSAVVPFLEPNPGVDHKCVDLLCSYVTKCACLLEPQSSLQHANRINSI